MDKITNKRTIGSKEIRDTYLNGCSAVTLWRLRKNSKKFPKPVRIGGLLLWDREGIERWYLSLKVEA